MKRHQCVFHASLGRLALARRVHSAARGAERALVRTRGRGARSALQRSCGTACRACIGCQARSRDVYVGGLDRRVTRVPESSPAP